MIDRALPQSIKTLAALAKEEERAQKFLLLLQVVGGLPAPEREVRIHPTRQWKHDFVWRPRKKELANGTDRWTTGIILESEGGLYTNGGHSRGKGIENDIEKANELQLLGWIYLRVPSDKLATSKTVDLVIRALNSR